MVLYMQWIVPIALVMWYGGSIIIKAQTAKRARFFKLIKCMFWTVVIVFIMCRRTSTTKESQGFSAIRTVGARYFVCFFKCWIRCERNTSDRMTNI